MRKNQSLLDEIKAGKEAFLARFGPLMESNEKPINPYRIFLEIIPALRRALEANAKNQPAYLGFICSQHPVYGGWIRDAQVGHERFSG